MIAVFFLNGVNFALRDSEHYSLKISQIVEMTNHEGYVYSEYGSKNRPGVLQDFRVPNKRVPVYRCPQAQDRCHVYLLDLYLSKLPVQAFIDDTVYMRPLPTIPPAAHLPWFTNSHLGKHAISKMLTNMCSEAGIEKKLTTPYV